MCSYLHLKLACNYSHQSVTVYIFYLKTQTQNCFPSLANKTDIVENVYLLWVSCYLADRQLQLRPISASHADKEAQRISPSLNKNAKTGVLTCSCLYSTVLVKAKKSVPESESVLQTGLNTVFSGIMLHIKAEVNVILSTL